MTDCKITKVEVPVLLENLTEEQITQLFNRICEQDPVLFNTFANGDGTIENATTGPVPVVCGDSLLLWSSDGSILVDLTAGSTIYDIRIDPAAIEMLRDGENFVESQVGNNVDVNNLPDPTVPAPTNGFTAGDMVKTVWDNGIQFSVFDGTNWEKCFTSNDTAGEVLQWDAGVPLTTTNGVEINPGQNYISFPGGTTWASDVCNTRVQRVVIDTSALTAGADSATFDPQLGIIGDGDGSTSESISDIQAWIDANVDYSAATTVVTNLNPIDPATSGNTDASFLEFWANITQETTLSYVFSGEGFLRIEVDQCGCGEYEIAAELHSLVGNSTPVSTTVGVGLHKIRITQVDVDGAASLFQYTGDTFEFFAPSSGTPTSQLQELFVDCAGNLFNENGTSLEVAHKVEDWPCGSGIIVKVDDILGLVDDNNVTTYLTSNTVYDLLNFPPTGPINPPTDATSGDTVVQRFQNGLGYFTHNGTDWNLNFFETDDNQRFTCRDETGQDYVQGSLAGPQNPPPNPSQADTHLEIYDNAAVIFNFQESGPAAGWDGNNICFIPLNNSSSKWTIENINTTTALVVEDIHMYRYSAIPDQTTTLNISQIPIGCQFEISVNDQDNIGQLTIDGPTILSQDEGGINGSNASYVLPQGATCGFRKVSTDIIEVIYCVDRGDSGGGVNSITGKSVDNTNPANPVVRDWIKQECYEEVISVQLNNNGNTRNLGPDFEGLTISHVIQSTAFSPAGPQGNRLTSIQATIDNTGSGSLVVTNQTTGQSSATSTESWTGAFSSLTEVVFTLDDPLTISPGDLIIATTVGSGGRWRFNLTGNQSGIVPGSSGTGPDGLSGHFDGLIANNFIVRTLDDSSLCTVDEDANTTTPLASIPANWTLCPDTSSDSKLSRIECYTDGATEFDVFTYCDNTQKAFNRLTGDPVDISGGIPGDVNIGSPFTITQPDDDLGAGLTSYPVVPGVVEFARSGNSGIYNFISETNFGPESPEDTLWRNDTETDFTNFSDAYRNQIGNNILTPAYGNAVMQVVSTGQFFEVTPLAWQMGGGGGFSFTFQEVQIGWELCPENITKPTITKAQCEIDTLAPRILASQNLFTFEGDAQFGTNPIAGNNDTVILLGSNGQVGGIVNATVNTIPNETYDVQFAAQQAPGLPHDALAELTIRVLDLAGNTLGELTQAVPDSDSVNFFLNGVTVPTNQVVIQIENTTDQANLELIYLNFSSIIYTGPQVFERNIDTVCEIEDDGSLTPIAHYIDGAVHVPTFTPTDCPVCDETLSCIDSFSRRVFDSIKEFLPDEMGGVNSITGKSVDNTDPVNPVIRDWIKEECYDPTERAGFQVDEDQSSNGIAGNFGNLTFTGNFIDLTVQATGPATEFRILMTNTGAAPVTPAFDNPIFGGNAAADAPLAAGATDWVTWTLPSTPVTAGAAAALNTPNFGGDIEVHGTDDDTNAVTRTGDVPIAARLVVTAQPSVKIRTLDDGSLCQVDLDVNTVTPLESIPVGWTLTDCDPVLSSEVKAVQNLSVGQICFEESVTNAGDIVDDSELASTVVNTINSGVLGGAAVPGLLAEWTSTVDGTITDIQWLHSQLEPTNAGSNAEFIVTNITTGDTGSEIFNPGTLGVSFGDAPTEVSRTLDSIVTVSVGDVIRIEAIDNNGNDWGISSVAGGEMTWVGIGAAFPDTPGIGLSGDVTIVNNLSLEKVICQDTGDVTHYDANGTLVNVSTFTEVPCVDSDNQTAEQVSYDNTNSSLAAVNAQEAIDELASPTSLLFQTETSTTTLTGPAQDNSFNTFTPHISGEYDLRHFASSVTGTIGLNIGTTLGGSDTFSSVSNTTDRITETETDKTFIVTLEAETEYFIRMVAGGGSIGNDIGYEFRYRELDTGVVEALEVEDASSLIADRPLTNFTGPFEIHPVLNTGLTWQQVKDDYESIRIEASTSDGSLTYFTTDDIQTDSIVPGHRVRMLDGLFDVDTNFNLELGFENLAGSDLRIISSVGTLANWSQIGVRIWGVRAQKTVAGFGTDTLETTGFESVRDAILGNYGRGTPTSGTSAPSGQERSVPLANVVVGGDITYDAVNNGFVVPDGAVVEINGITQSSGASQNDIRFINSTTSLSNIPGLTEIPASTGGTGVNPVSIFQGIYANDTGSDVIIGIGVSGGGNTGNSNTTGYLMVRRIN